MAGAGGFGSINGWWVYYINPYRKVDVQLSDIVTLSGIVGGGAILALFTAGTDLFGAYGIGLFGGFFGCIIILLVWVAISKYFELDWFLDGRRKRPEDPFYLPGQEEDPAGRGMLPQGEPPVNP